MNVILLHGFSNTKACWRRVLGFPTQHGDGVVLTPDIRGHGASSDVRPVSLAGVLDDIVVDAPAEFVLAGYSQGGRIALHAALDPRLAGRVQRLVLIGASPGLADGAERAARRAADKALAARVEQMTISEFAEDWERTSVLAGLPAPLQAEARVDRLGNTPDGLAAALRGLGTGALPSLWDRLGELSVPVELIVGARDLKFTEIASEMAASIPTARVHVVAGAGHAVHLERPDVVAQRLWEGSVA